VRTFRVYGSAGELVVGRMSGRMLDHVDILDPGYWTEGGAYAPPEYTWRACAREDGG